MKRLGKNRIHLDFAPHAHVNNQDEVKRLTRLAGTLIDIGKGRQLGSHG